MSKIPKVLLKGGQLLAVGLGFWVVMVGLFVILFRYRTMDFPFEERVVMPNGIIVYQPVHKSPDAWMAMKCVVDLQEKERIHHAVLFNSLVYAFVGRKQVERVCVLDMGPVKGDFSGGGIVHEHNWMGDFRVYPFTTNSPITAVQSVSNRTDGTVGRE